MQNKSNRLGKHSLKGSGYICMPFFPPPRSHLSASQINDTNARQGISMQRRCKKRLRFYFGSFFVVGTAALSAEAPESGAAQWLRWCDVCWVARRAAACRRVDGEDAHKHAHMRARRQCRLVSETDWERHVQTLRGADGSASWRRME